MAFRVLTDHRLRVHSSNLYLAALSIYDCLVLTFNFLIGMLRGQNTDVNRLFQENEALCRAHSVFVEVFNLLSVWMIVCFTFERFISVRFPLRVQKWCTSARAKKIIGILSAVLIIFSCHKILLTGFEGDSVYGYKACVSKRFKFREAIFFYTAFNTWLPSILIMAFNIGIITKIREASVQRRSMSSAGSNTSGQESAERKITRTLLTVSFAYLLLVIPLGVLQTVELTWNSVMVKPPSACPPAAQQDYVHYMYGKLILKWLRALCFSFYQANFAINFFLYIATGQKFREILGEQYGCLATDKRGGSRSGKSGASTANYALSESVRKSPKEEEGFDNPDCSIADESPVNS